jgi:hypothetical protein
MEDPEHDGWRMELFEDGGWRMEGLKHGLWGMIAGGWRT